MATALGRLAASLYLDLADWTVGTETAKRSAAATAISIDRSFADLQKSVTSKLTGLAGAFAAGFGIHALKESFDAYATGAAALVDLAGKAGTTIEKMSQLSPIAKLSGSSMEELAAGMEKLSKGIVNSNKETAGAGKALAFLGVSAYDSNGKLKDSATLMEEIAPKLARYGDGIAKTTLLMDLHGKAGAALAPIYKDLAEFGVQDAMVTERQAKLAKEYEQDLVRLGIAKSAIGKIISKEVLPVADALVKTFLQMATSSGGVRDAVKGLAEDSSIRSFAMSGVNAIGLLINAGDSVVRIFKLIGEEVGYQMAKVGTALGGIADAVIDFIRGDYRKAWGDIEDASGRGAAMMIDHGEKMRAILEKPLAGDAFVATVAKNLDEIDHKMNSNAESAKKVADGYKKIGDAAKSAASDALIASLRQEIANLDLVEVGSNKYSQVLIQIARIKEHGKPVAEETIKRLALEYDHTVNLRAELESLYKIEEELDTLRQVKIEHARVLIEKLQDENEKTALENSLIGQTAAQQKLANIELERRIALRGVDNQIAVDQINKAYDLKKALASQGDTIREQVTLWDQVSQKAGAFFGDLVMNGQSAFTKLRAELKTFVQDLLALFAQKWVLQMVAGGSALAGQAASAGANTLGGSALNALGLGGGSMIDALGLGGGAFAGAAGAGFSAGLSTLGIAASAGASAVGGFTAVLGAAVPVIGWIVAAGALLYSVFGSKGGGPKDGGSFNESFSATGASLGATGNRFFTPSGQDASLATAGRGTAASYFAALRALGGTAPGNVTFGLGYDTDPSGTAPNRISSGVSVNGQTVFGSQDRSIGRDNAQIAPQLQLEASRMLLAALQASTLPQYLAKVFDGLTPSTATQAQIDAALQQAAALKTIFDVVTRNPMKDIAAAMDAQLNPLQSALKNNATTIAAAMSAYDKSTASTQNLAAATTSYYNAQLQLIAGIQQAKAAIDDMFGATFRNIQIAGLKDNQAKYNFYQQDAAELQRQALASSDPATIQRLTGIINQDIAAAFSLLTPAEQQAQSGAFLARGKDTQAAIDARLEKITKDAADAMQKTLDKIKDLIGAGAEAQTNAANTQVTAANTNLAAATTPRQLIILLPNGQQQVTSFG